MRDRYADFGPTLAAEKLAEYQEKRDYLVIDDARNHVIFLDAGDRSRLYPTLYRHPSYETKVCYTNILEITLAPLSMGRFMPAL